MADRFHNQFVLRGDRLHLTPIRKLRHAELGYFLQHLSTIERRGENLAHVREKSLALFQALSVIDVRRRREEANDGTVFRVHGHGALEKPIVLSGLRANSSLNRKVSAALSGGLPSGFDGGPVVGMERLKPAVVLKRLRFTQTGELEPTAIKVIDLAVGTSGADDLRHGVGKHAEHALVVHCGAPGPLGHQRRLLAIVSTEGVIERGELENKVTGSPRRGNKDRSAQTKDPPPRLSQSGQALNQNQRDFITTKAFRRVNRFQDSSAWRARKRRRHAMRMCALTSASLRARCASNSSSAARSMSRKRRKVWFLWSGASGNSARASSIVQRPLRPTAGPTKDRSNRAQCAATTRPLHRRRKWLRARPRRGAPLTMSSVMPWTAVACDGMAIPGSTSVAHRPTIRSPSISAHATSTIRSRVALNPVVSTSMTAYCPRSMMPSSPA